MKKQELRIGIIMFDSVRQKNIRIELKHFKELEIAEKNFFERYKPIELTPQWLERLGFVKGQQLIKVDTQEYIKKVGRLKIDVTHCKQSLNGAFFYFINNASMGKIKYVHQLQNLFFALTQTEPTLKP